MRKPYAECPGSRSWYRRCPCPPSHPNGDQHSSFRHYFDISRTHHPGTTSTHLKVIRRHSDRYHNPLPAPSATNVSPLLCHVRHSSTMHLVDDHHLEDTACTRIHGGRIHHSISPPPTTTTCHILTHILHRTFLVSPVSIPIHRCCPWNPRTLPLQLQSSCSICFCRR